MNKKIICFLLVLAQFILTLCACTSGGNTDETSYESGSGDQETSLPDHPEETTSEAMSEYAEWKNAGRKGAGIEALSDKYDYRNIIISSVYATGKKLSTPVCNSYIELYNVGKEPIDLAGLSVFYSDGGEYIEYGFDKDSIVPAGGYYLILCASFVKDTAKYAEKQTFFIQKSDAEFELFMDGGDMRLVIAPSGTNIDPEKPLAENDGIYEWVSTNPLDSDSLYHYADNMNSNKLLRKEARAAYAEYEKINLTKASYVILEQVRPKCASGDLNTQVKSRISEVVFSKAGGIYEDSFELELTCPDGYTVYYTVNGDDPRTGQAIRYEKPISISDTSDMPWRDLVKRSYQLLGSTYLPVVISQPGGITVKAYATNGKDCSGLVTQTYFVGTSLSEYGVDVLNFSLAPDDFLGSETGIYNMVMKDVTGEHEKADAYLEYYSKNGDRAFASWVEIAMNGKGSLGMTEKSFRVLFKSGANDTVDENLSMLDYDLFGKYATDSRLGDKQTFFKRILLRNGGGDNSGCTISRSHLGDAYIARMDTGLNVETMAYAPVLVFINGEFWGIYNARERFDSEYFQTTYALAEEDVTVLECPYPLRYGWNVDYMVACGEEGDEKPFNDLVQFVVSHDMADPDNYAYVCQQIDIQNFIDHFCAQMYLCCSDWPSNNVKVWRNKNPEAGMDTKWRLCIVDTDHGVGLNSTVDQNLWGAVSDASIIGRIVNHLRQNPEFRDLFIERFIWCTEVLYTPERMLAGLDEMYNNLVPIMQLQLDRWRVTDGSVTTWEKWYSYIEIIRNFVSNRQPFARKQVKQFFDLNDKQYDQYYKSALERYGSCP